MLIILEGARGTGKSTIAFKLRQKMKNSTLINFTGFNEDGKEGLEKISNYYKSWFALFRNFNWKVKDQVIICDRFYPSEMVFSSLYKEYDFTQEYVNFCRLLPTLADEIYIINFTINDENELKNRLLRDKIPFGKADESVIETLKQQHKYKELFKEMKDMEVGTSFENKINFAEIDTTRITTDEIFEEVFKLIKQ
jgi:deoxyguanosine kinase